MKTLAIALAMLCSSQPLHRWCDARFEAVRHSTSRPALSPLAAAGYSRRPPRLLTIVFHSWSISRSVPPTLAARSRGSCEHRRIRHGCGDGLTRFRASPQRHSRSSTCRCAGQARHDRGCVVVVAARKSSWRRRRVLLSAATDATQPTARPDTTTNRQEIAHGVSCSAERLAGSESTYVQLDC